MKKIKCLFCYEPMEAKEKSISFHVCLPNTCDNTDHDENKPCEDIKEVEMREEFEGGTAHWCAECRKRDSDFIN